MFLILAGRPPRRRLPSLITTSYPAPESRLETFKQVYVSINGGANTFQIAVYTLHMSFVKQKPWSLASLVSLLTQHLGHPSSFAYIQQHRRLRVDYGWDHLSRDNNNKACLEQ